MLVAGGIGLIDVNNYPAPVFAYPATQIRSLQNTYEILRLFRGDTVVCYLLMSFCCGQLAALLFRSLVLAGLFAFVANCILLIVVAALHQSASLLIFGPLFLMAQVISYLSFVRRMNSLSNDPKGFGLNLLDFERNEDSLVIRLRLR